jgi:hypothetical protein
MLIFLLGLLVLGVQFGPVCSIEVFILWVITNLICRES